MTAAVQQHKDGGEGTDALWRAQAKVKELTQLAKQARKQAEKAAAAPAAAVAAPTSEAEAVAALEAAMAGDDLTALKAAIAVRLAAIGLHPTCTPPAPSPHAPPAGQGHRQPHHHTDRTRRRADHLRLGA